MIEENILNWIELGDSIQKMDLYKKNLYIFNLFCSLSQHGQYPIYFYYFFIFIFFGQIWCLNVYAIKDIEGDLLLEVINYFDNFFLLENLLTKNTAAYIILLFLSIFIFLLTGFLIFLNAILIKKKIKNGFLLTITHILCLLYVYYLNGPFLEIVFSELSCKKENDENSFEFCSLAKTSNLIKLILCIIYGIFTMIYIMIISLYFNEIGCINGTNVKCKISSNFSVVMMFAKLICFFFHFVLLNFIGKNNETINLLYLIFFVIFNFGLMIYANKALFYYNYSLNNWAHNAWYFSTWFSACIFFKFILKIRIISLIIFFGIIIIYIGIYFQNYYSIFNLVTKFNIFEANTLKDIEKYNTLLLFLLKSHENNNKILLLGIIERFEEYIAANPELNEQYQKLIQDKYLQKKFSSNNELIVLSIISIVYSHNIEKSKDIADLTLSMCYFLVNTFKNPTYAIWLCTKIKERTHIQSYYKYVLMEEIKLYLLNNLTKNKNKLSIRHIQISSVILYNQYVDLFKMKIYDATCSQIEYFDLLKNNTTTAKTTKNFLKIGEDILNLKKDILNLWNKIILLNPFSDESQKDYMIYIEVILQDDTLMRSEEKKFTTLKTEKLSERNNLYYSMFIQDLSTVIISDGYSYNGKIIYTTPNFPSMFYFSGKEVLNCTIDDLLPDVVQIFHKYLIEDAIKFSNLTYIFKNQRNVLIKGKNGLLFNIYLYVKPSPNLSYGLTYFSNIQKRTEENVVLILDENLIINGFSGIIQAGSNFSLNNNYGLTYGINGHHIGIIIPEILLQINYIQNQNIFTLSQNGVDLKGTLYPLLEFGEFDKSIKPIMELIKSKKSGEIGLDKNSAFAQEYFNFIKSLNSACPKSYSIFFKIESHSFLRGKYHYYRIYIINDLFSTNDTNSIINTDINKYSQVISKSEHKHNDDNSKAQNIFAKSKTKTLIESAVLDSKKLIDMIDLNQGNEKIEKFIRLKTEKKRTREQKSEKSGEEKKEEIKSIRLVDSKKDNTNNNKDMHSSENNKNNINNLDLLLDLSRTSSPASILTQSSTDSIELNKLKNEISNKRDSFYIRMMKYFIYIYGILVLVFIMIDFYQNATISYTLTGFLKQNLFFTRTKINVACIYNSFIGLKYIKDKYVDNNSCEIPCHVSYQNLLNKCFADIESKKSELYLYHEDFTKIFQKTENVSVHGSSSKDYDYLSLDINNWLNLIISHSIKIYSSIGVYLFSPPSVNDAMFQSYIENILENSYKFFYSNYKGFYGEAKEKKCREITAKSPMNAIIISIIAFIILVISGYYIFQINKMEIFYLERLINFTSPNFEGYLKKLEQLKKKFREDNNEEEDKNNDEGDNKDDLELIDENISGRKDKRRSLEKINNINKIPKKKKSKQNKLLQKRLEKKKIMSKFFYKKNFVFLLKAYLIISLSIVYFIVSIIYAGIQKKDYFQFDSIIEQINKVYYDSFNIFLKITKGIENFTNANNAMNYINLPKDSDIIKPKFGNILMNLMNDGKLSNKTLQIFNTLYNGNACELIAEGPEMPICRNIFSSILTKGIEQSIVQMGVIISSCLDQLNSVKTIDDFKKLIAESDSFLSYETFMGKFLPKAFWKTHELIDIFRQSEQESIFRTNNILLIFFMIVSIILFIFLIYFIHDYVIVQNSFLNFIGIVPSKFISDDELLYSNILKLQELY